jgi:PD-(D/E)XK nuclease superfamily
MKPLKYSKDNVVAFRDEDHTYFLTENEKIKFTSCTTFFKQFEERKDWNTIKKAYAKKHKITVPAVTKMWEEKRDNAAIQGTAIHLMLENLIQGQTMTANGNDVVISFPKHKVALQFFNDYFVSGKWEALEVEGILYNLELMLAGQRDLKIKDEQGRICIVDYKTNEELKEAFSDGGKLSTLLPPFNSLEDSHLVKYSLQMALYDYMDEDEIYKRYIVHIKEDDYEIIEGLPLELELREGKLQLHRSHKYITEEDVTPPLIRFSKFKK